MRKVFADSFFFIALLSDTDESHEKAVGVCRDSGLQLITTEWVLIELADGMVRSRNRSRVSDFLRQLPHAPNIAVVDSSPGLFAAGREEYCRHTDKAWSLTDCLSFVVMRRFQLREALTGDHHFEQAGFSALLK